ncbi:V4R domain-containing protein [Dermatophilus congolensis]|uniref:V4R domain n=1 Tax=Dermatophilus congolensis TaxID=1863 RepID=A0A239V7R8_9MICO|nr:4-vinyl reductase [Dermatophilus congolensis]MBO3130445.1 4-vinyl reductase [Dermatophilus congolensis]MBO3130924.1 4-vinyl reductase [Dermatophilus congolensis]MBO3134917.1 4-vinyl reductase [Dermatophilus congolensis]MBO3137156.1 4-vinyl reductase [Dermatophilus congolensis]MBO3139399.1 4-vinyl reductase [Dermatophilus congolensis]
MPTNTRPTLGKFVAAECLQQMRLHVEDLAGPGPVLGAGRMRGAGLVELLGKTGASPSIDDATDILQKALGLDGTRLAIVDDITEDNGTYTVRIHEGACSFDRKSDEPMCAYTLGVFVGAIGSLYGATMTGKELECEAMGDSQCVYRIKRHIALD